MTFHDFGLDELPKSWFQDVESWLSTFASNTRAGIKKALFQTTSKHWNHKEILGEKPNSHTGKSLKSIGPITLQNGEIQFSQNMSKFLQNQQKQICWLLLNIYIEYI